MSQVDNLGFELDEVKTPRGEAAVDVPDSKSTKNQYESRPSQHYTAQFDVPTGFDYLKRIIGFQILFNVLLSFVVLIIIGVWVDEDKNDIYTDSCHGFAVFAAVYAFLANIVHALVGVYFDKGRKLLHIVIFFNCILIVLFLLGAASCIAKSSEDIRKAGKCERNDCGDLVAVSVFGFINLIGFLIQLVLHWFDISAL